MSTVAELCVDEELSPLREIADLKGWELERRDPTTFILGLPARDRTWFWLMCRCEKYPGIPAAWHWFNAAVGSIDQSADTPDGGGFFHGSGVICAPWNLLAYKSEDPRGPHSDWAVGDWRSNPKTGGCRTLAAMALRIAVELQAPHFAGRRG